MGLLATDSRLSIHICVVVSLLISKVEILYQENYRIEVSGSVMKSLSSQRSQISDNRGKFQTAFILSVLFKIIWVCSFWPYDQVQILYYGLTALYWRLQCISRALLFSTFPKWRRRQKHSHQIRTYANKVSEIWKNHDLLRNIWKLKVSRQDGSHVKSSRRWPQKSEIKCQDNRKRKEEFNSSVFFCLGQKQELMRFFFFFEAHSDGDEEGGREGLIGQGQEIR